MTDQEDNFAPVRRACFQLARVLVDLTKAMTDPSDYTFWENLQFKTALNNYRSAIDEYFPQGAKWDGFWVQFSIDDAWKKADQDVCTVATFLESKVISMRLQMDDSWIAFTPLGRQFCEFPEFTDFDDFAIVNAANKNPRDAASRFKSICEKHLGVNFSCSSEIEDSYQHKYNKLLRASSSYFPIRPQLVLLSGKGLAMLNFREYKYRLDRLLPLIALCELITELQTSSDDDAGAAYSSPSKHDVAATLPNGDRMPLGLIKIPDVAVMLNVDRGNVWDSGPLFQRYPDFGLLPLFETNRLPMLSAEAFRENWKSWGWTHLVLLDAMDEIEANSKFRNAFEGSIGIMAQCRHWRALRFPDPNLYSVIATESLLNPFRKDKIQERFAGFGSALRESELAERNKLQDRLKELYEQRCDFVHASGRFYDSDDQNDAIFSRNPCFAIRHYLACLHHVHVWASDQLRNDKPLSERAFEEFYLRTTESPEKLSDGC